MSFGLVLLIVIWKKCVLLQLSISMHISEKCDSKFPPGDFRAGSVTGSCSNPHIQLLKQLVKVSRVTNQIQIRLWIRSHLWKEWIQPIKAKLGVASFHLNYLQSRFSTLHACLSVVSLSLSVCLSLSLSLCLTLSRSVSLSLSVTLSLNQHECTI